MDNTPIHSIQQLKSNKNRLLGIDYGDSHIGLSICDLTWTIASPLKTLKPKDFLQEFQKLIQQENITAFVVGWPVNMNGSKSLQCQKIEKFLDTVLSIQSIPLHLWDERLSTLAVHRTMIEADLSRKRQKQVVDKMAATYLLQGFLDRIHSCQKN